MDVQIRPAALGRPTTLFLNRGLVPPAALFLRLKSQKAVAGDAEQPGPKFAPPRVEPADLLRPP